LGRRASTAAADSLVRLSELAEPPLLNRRSSELPELVAGWGCQTELVSQVHGSGAGAGRWGITIRFVDPRYDAIADFYDAAVAGDVRDVGSVALLDFAGDVRGRRVADIACGQGRIARELARRGADVVAVDVSDALLAKALAAGRDDQLGVIYVRADVTVAGALAGETFDGVVCNDGLSDIDDLDGVLATVSRVLKPAAWFVFSILHPCFPGWDEHAPSSWRRLLPGGMVASPQHELPRKGRC
jgi:2-polyprenyl-3-methyl-5-hydroxy-6-metoxy-1,4-benzoquinol methylase